MSELKKAGAHTERWGAELVVGAARGGGEVFVNCEGGTVTLCLAEELGFYPEEKGVAGNLSGAIEKKAVNSGIHMGS